MTFKQAANELQSIRNDLASGMDRDVLQKRTDAIGEWLAINGKPTGLSAKLLSEANVLHDKINGGNGKHGVRIAMGN